MEEWTRIVSLVDGFDWVEGNINKNWEKHGVAHIECEEIFFNKPVMVKKDESRSMREHRYFALGKTDTERLLFIVFTVRGRKIRVISARNMSRKERKAYEQVEKDSKI
ncbi:MAG: BrnT family toxin [Nitrospirota bacterium]